MALSCEHVTALGQLRAGRFHRMGIPAIGSQNCIHICEAIKAFMDGTSNIHALVDKLKSFAGFKVRPEVFLLNRPKLFL
jgi:hypothetical protein